jgi:TetR/AcrR family transcriptional regulator, transcriptional repressor for nem operon
MAKSQADKADTHARIVAVASRRLREKGLEGVGVADLMKEAGLTVGGFYKHFASRDALVAEAMQDALGLWQKQSEAGAPRSWRAIVDPYLSPGHRDCPETGCPFGALASDLARADAKTRAVATQSMRQSLDRLAGLIQPDDPAAGRSRAMLAYAAMIGAIGLSRIADDAALSREILDAVREELDKLPPEDEAA